MNRTLEAQQRPPDAMNKILEQPNSLLAAIVDSSNDAIISKDLTGIITSWNQAATNIFGYEAEEIVGQPILRLIPKELYPEEANILHKLRSGERIEHYETIRVRKSGKKIEVSLTISPVKDSTGRIVGSSKIARDISDRKQMERSLIQAEKLASAGRMAATIAHEINNPLESLLNLVFLARENCAGNSEADGYLRTAEKELERLSHIARQTLGFYRDIGTLTEVLVDELLKDVLAVYQSKLQARKIVVRCQFEAMHTLKANRGELLQVFSNIVANSIDAMKSGGFLDVQTLETTNAEGAGIQVVLRDQGSGIEAEDLVRIFEPFFTTKERNGTGIGLWVAKQLVEKHGGRITITSNAEAGNSGTEVLIFLPFEFNAIAIQ